MITKRIIPCLDVKNGRVVKGVNFEGLQDMADPVEMARYYNASGADELVFYDITASVEGRGLFTDILRRVASQIFIPLTVGGGINTPDDFDRVLKCGADKVSVNSGAIRNPGIIPAAAQKYGNQCVVLSADIKRVDGKFMLFAKGGRENTGIDALKTTVRKEYHHELLTWAQDSRLIMLTAHRRENLGEHLYSMFRAIKRIVDETPDVKVIYPVHLNPVVRKTAQDVFGDNARIRLTEPMEVIDFHNFLARSYMILTDSGGVQEEAPSLGKPVLVMRDTTERPEGIEAGTLRLVGTEEETIYRNFRQLLDDRAEYEKMSQASNPYGDGNASRRIVEVLKSI